MGSQLQVQIMWYSFVTQVLKFSVVLSKVSSCLILNKRLKEKKIVTQEPNWLETI